MKDRLFLAIVIILGVLLVGAIILFSIDAVDAREFSFFVTSVGLGDGANLGGIEGADAHCQNR